MHTAKTSDGDHRTIAAKNIRSARTALLIALVSIFIRPVASMIFTVNSTGIAAIRLIEALMLFALVIIFLSMVVRNVNFLRRRSDYRTK